MQALIIGAIGALAGVLLGFWLGKTSAQAESGLLLERVKGLEEERAKQAIELKGLQDSITRMAGELGTAVANVTAEKNKYALMKADIETAFGDLAAKALSANNQIFLTLAKRELGGQANEAKQTLEAKEVRWSTPTSSVWKFAWASA